jgi:mannose-6-phosphate isomerase-like protein (cupin superfamily)
MNTTRQPIFLPADGGELLPWPETTMRVLASSEHSDGKLAVIYDRSPARMTVDPHIHDAEDEAFYILDGEYTITCGDEEFVAGAGAFAYLPAGMPHSQRIGDTPASKLVITAPAGFERFFRAMSEGFTSGAMSLGFRNEAAAQHGIRFLTGPG